MVEVNRFEAQTKAEESWLRLIRISLKKVLNGRNLRRSDWYCGRRCCIDVDRRCMRRLVHSMVKVLAILLTSMFDAG